MVETRRTTIPLALALVLALALACLIALGGCAANGASSSTASSNSPDQKDVSVMEQLQVSTTRCDYAEVGEQTGHGGYGEYTEVAVESAGYDELKAALESRNKLAATTTVDRVHDHANDPNAQSTTEGHELDVLLGGVDNTVQAVDFINFISQAAVTRADSSLTCLLETSVSEIDGWGKKLSFSSHVYDSATGKELALGDLVTDTAQLPELIDAAMHEKYYFEGMFEEDEDVAQIVRGKLEDPAANGALAWTADYLSMKFYFNSSDLSHADTYQGMYVSLPYAEHPELFADACKTLPDEFIAQLEYGKTYALPDDAQGRSVRVTRTHDDDARPQGLLGTSPNTSNATAGWQFAVEVGTGEGDDFTPTGEAATYPWFYDMHRQDYMPSLVRVDGNWYVYGFGDRNSENYPTAVFKLDGEVELVKEFEEGFTPSAPYTTWAFPSNPAAVTMADRDCLASYDRILFERACSIDGATGLPAPAAESYQAHTKNQAYKMRMSVNGTLVGEDGQLGDATVIDEGAVCFLEAGLRYNFYDMRLEDGRLVRLECDPRTRKVDDHYTADIMSMVPAHTAASATIESGPRQRTVNQHGHEVPLVPETGNLVGMGAILDYGDTPWWVAEEFVGTWKMTEGDRELIADWYAEGKAPADGSLEIREDGTFTFAFDGRAFEGSLNETRGWGVYAGGSMASADGGDSQDVYFDYASDDDHAWKHLEFRAAGLPYPLHEQSPDIFCFLTRV